MAKTFASLGLEEGQSRRATANGGTNKPTPTLQQSPLPFAERLGCSPREACAALGVGRTLLYQLISEGRLEVAKLGRRTIVSIPALLRLMDAPAAEPKPRRHGRPRKTERVVAR
jgi:excisionase family DNA binding protein